MRLQSFNFPILMMVVLAGSTMNAQDSDYYSIRNESGKNLMLKLTAVASGTDPLEAQTVGVGGSAKSRNMAIGDKQPLPVYTNPRTSKKTTVWLYVKKGNGYQLSIVEPSATGDVGLSQPTFSFLISFNKDKDGLAYLGSDSTNKPTWTVASPSITGEIVISPATK
jgi:hypothetical protein